MLAALAARALELTRDATLIGLGTGRAACSNSLATSAVQPV